MMLFLCALIATAFACDYETNTIVPVSSTAGLISAVENLQNGQTIELAEGRYEVADLQITNKDCVVFRPQTGLDGSPVEVTLDASIPLSGLNVQGPWTSNGELWSVELAAGVTVWQLFKADDSEISLARYPNVQGEDIWNASLAFRQQDEDMSSDGEVVDALRPCEDSDSPTALAQQPNFDNCMAVLNIGHWETIEAQISNHVGDSFSYTNEQVTYKDNLGRYFVECLAALDAPNEWGFDWESNELVVRLPEGVASPNDATLRGKRADFIFSVLNSNYIQFQHLNFFAGGVRMTRVKNSEVSDCTFTYSSYNKRALQQSKGAPGALVFLGQGLSQNQQDVRTDNTVRDCEFRNTDGAALVMQLQRNNIVRDNLFSHIDYSAAYAHGAVDFQSSDDTTFEYNTVNTTGSSETIRAGSKSTIFFNYFTNGGLLQEDGAAVQVRTANQDGTEITQNWAINNAKKGFRFDTANKPTVNGQYSNGENGVMDWNVAFNNRGGFTAKGNHHTVTRNTALMNGWFTRGNANVEAGTMDMAIWERNSQFPDQEYNMDTDTTRNLVQRLSGSSSGEFVDVPGTTNNNYNGFEQDEHVFNKLRDPLHGDFRPKGCANSEGTCKGANNWGAYSQGKHKKNEMWVPGRRLENAASFALPYDGSEGVPMDVDLKWRRARNNKCKYDVYMTRDVAPEDDTLDSWLENDSNWVTVSTNHNNRHNLALNSKILAAVGQENWIRGRTYYWRVETVRSNGNRCSVDMNGNVPGEAVVWSFTLAEEDFIFQERGECATMFDTFDEAEVQQTLRDFASMSNSDDITSYCANPDVEELWENSAFFGSGPGESNYFEYNCDTWQCGLAMIKAPVCDLLAVAEATTQLGHKKQVAKRAAAVSSNVCDLSYCDDADQHTSNGAPLPTISTDYTPSTCVLGMLESEMEFFSDLLQDTIRQVFGSLTETQMVVPAWATTATPGDSCKNGSFECDAFYCDSAEHPLLQQLRDTFTSGDMDLLQYSATSTCTEDQVLTAAMNIGGKLSFQRHFARVHECWSSEWSTSGATRRLLAMAYA